MCIRIPYLRSAHSSVSCQRICSTILHIDCIYVCRRLGFSYMFLCCTFIVQCFYSVATHIYPHNKTDVRVDIYNIQVLCFPCLQDLARLIYHLTFWPTSQKVCWTLLQSIPHHLHFGDCSHVFCFEHIFFSPLLPSPSHDRRYRFVIYFLNVVFQLNGYSLKAHTKVQHLLMALGVSVVA